MDSRWPGFIGLILLIYTQSVSGLQCFKCTHIEVSSSSGILKPLLSGVSRFSNSHCALKNADDHRLVPRIPCGMPRPGEVNRCSVTKGIVTSTFLKHLGMKVRYYTLSRGCLSVNANSKDFSIGCHSNTTPNFKRYILSSAFKHISVGNIKFQGKTCYSDHMMALVSTASRLQTTLWLTFAGLMFLFCRWPW